MNSFMRCLLARVKPVFARETSGLQSETGLNLSEYPEKCALMRSFIHCGLHAVTTAQHDSALHVIKCFLCYE